MINLIVCVPIYYTGLLVINTVFYIHVYTCIIMLYIHPLPRVISEGYGSRSVSVCVTA